MLSFLKRHKAHASTFIFIVGFAIDFFALPEANETITKWFAVLYLLIFSSCISIRNSAHKKQWKITSLLQPYIPFIIAFFSGSLLSFVFVLYFRSASLIVSWPFFILLFATIVANEYITHKRDRLLLDLILLYTTFTFVLIYTVPYISGEMNNVSFIEALILASIGNTIFGFWIYKNTINTFAKKKLFSFLGVGVPACILLLYIIRILPPLPVSIVSSGIYHYIQKNSDGTYTLQPEQGSTSIWRTTTYKVTPLEPLYFFSAVSAPARLQAPIVHTWEWYNQSNHTWVEKFHITFPIVGGREEGYRGYSINTNLATGSWRVTVSLDSTRILDRKYFTISSN